MVVSKKTLTFFIALSALLFLPLTAFAAEAGAVPAIGPVRFEFIIFALTLLGVALLHDKTMYVALAGLAAIILFKLVFDPGLNFAQHFLGTQDFFTQMIDKELRQGEWPVLLNLAGLLFGFAILAKHFEESGIPDFLPKILPDNWTGGLFLLLFIMVISSFLDNIAAAMIGGTIALVVLKEKCISAIWPPLLPHPMPAAQAALSGIPQRRLCGLMALAPLMSAMLLSHRLPPS